LKRGSAAGHTGIGLESLILRPDSKQPTELVEAVASRGDKEAFSRLFEFYAPRVKGFLMRSGSTPELAEEIAQEALLSVWRKAAMFDPARASVATWIFTIARNLRIDRARRGSGVSADTLYEVLTGDAPSRPDDNLLSDERDQRVRAALQGLPNDQAQVVRLSFFEEKAHAEISETLGVPLGTVKSRLRLAMTKLRERLEDLS
jgi:RNA polymerase sigma-70 factor (ECF subfamily)